LEIIIPSPFVVLLIKEYPRLVYKLHFISFSLRISRVAVRFYVSLGFTYSDLYPTELHVVAEEWD
jgi:hypothetical protein